MRLGIHKSKDSFSERWIEYCEKQKIDYKLVNCYRNDIISQLSDCNALMWHFSQNNPKDMLFARQLIYSVQASGKKVFPDFNTSWHFNDKVGQKYLLESINAPLAETWIFYNRDEAIDWAEHTVFPKVFKLRGGAGSQNVRLVKSARHAQSLIRRAFGKGFPVYDAFGSLKERYRKYKLGKTDFQDILEGIARLLILPPYARAAGNERGYIYFQEFIPDNDYDIRVIVVGDRAFAIKRMIRDNDFRASGSGIILYGKENFQEHTITLAFRLAHSLGSQCTAFDFVYYNDVPYLLEISFGFMVEGYDPCEGYWDRELNWYEGRFNPYGWMVDMVVDPSKL